MSRVGAIVAGLGVLIVVARGPLVFAPEATLGVYRKLLQTNGRARGLGLVLLLSGIGIGLLARSEASSVAQLLRWFGWLGLGGAGLLLLLFPSPLRSVYQQIVDAVSDSTLLRGLGALSVLLGGLLVYLGATAL